VWKKRWVALHGFEIVYMDKEPTPKNMAEIQITKAQFTGASVVKEEDPDGDITGFTIHVSHDPLCVRAGGLCSVCMFPEFLFVSAFL
jgi:hypothetical protein